MSRLRAVLLALFALLICAAPAGARERTLYAVQQLGATGVVTFSIDLETGALTQQPGVETTVTSPAVPGISPDGRLLFVPDYSNDLVQGYVAEPEGPSAITGATAATGTAPNAAIPSPDDNHVWTADYSGDSVSGIEFDAGGALTALPGFPVSSSANPTTLAVSPKNDLIYLPGYGGDAVAGFRRASDGALTALSGSPFAVAGNPIDVEFTPDGSKVFVARQDDDAISTYDVNPTTGALSLAGTPASTADQPTGIAASPDGRFLFVADYGDNKLQSFAIGPDGSLTALNSADTTNNPGDTTISPDGRFVYTADFMGGKISGFAVDQTDGSMTALDGSPFGDYSGAVASFAIVPNQGPTAALSATSSGLTASLHAGGSADPDGSVASYSWDFGDGKTASGASSAQEHTYAAAGSYDITLTVTDDEGCSNEQIGTGQTIYCNGNSAARIQRQVTVSAPPAAFTLTKVSGKQARSRRDGRKVTRRVRTRFTLSDKANVTFRFQKSRRGNSCRRARAFRNFGRRMTRPARIGANQRTFARSIGGRRLTPGRYRVRLQGRTPAGVASALVTTGSFCVR